MLTLWIGTGDQYTEQRPLLNFRKFLRAADRALDKVIHYDDVILAVENWSDDNPPAPVRITHENRKQVGDYFRMLLEEMIRQGTVDAAP